MIISHRQVPYGFDGVLLRDRYRFCSYDLMPVYKNIYL